MKKRLRLLKKFKNKLQVIALEGITQFNSINLYFQDESRYGLKTYLGRCLTARGVKPIVKYQHAFKNTYLYGSFSPINGDSFIYEIEGATSEIFYEYLKDFSEYNPSELKIIIIDNAGFHSISKYTMPKNIKLIRIPAYSPELNPSEKIWAYIKRFYKNKVFQNLDNVKKWLHDFVRDNLNPEIIKSITHDDFFLNDFNEVF